MASQLEIHNIYYIVLMETNRRSYFGPFRNRHNAEKCVIALAGMNKTYPDCDIWIEEREEKDKYEKRNQKEMV